MYSEVQKQYRIWKSERNWVQKSQCATATKVVEVSSNIARDKFADIFWPS